MNSLGLSGFGGINGRILRETSSFGTFFTGVILAGTLWLTEWFLGGFDAGILQTVLFQAIWAAAFARFALNGFFGEWGGTILSTAGGSWGAVALVAGRFLALTAVWVVPSLLLRVDFNHAGHILGSVLFGGPVAKLPLLLLVLYVTATALTPPVFLIVSVAATSFVEIFSPAHWRTTLARRGADMFLIYATYLGAVTLVLFLVLPLFVLTFGVNKDFGLFVGSLGLIYAVGFAAALLGRLCGFFASFAGYEGSGAAMPATDPALPGTEAPIAPASAASSIAGSRTTGATPAALSPEDAARPLGGTQLSLVSKPRTPSGKPPLMNARDRVLEILARRDSEPEAALQALERLNEEYAEHPLVLHSLCLLYRKSGERDAAMRIAGEAMPLLLSRGNLRLAAEILHSNIDRLEEFGLRRDESLALADQLRQIKLYPSAAMVQAAILREDPGDTKAIKGMLRLADLNLHQVGAVEDARKIYRFLLDHCAESPLADFMQQGLEEADRRVANE